MIIRLYKRYVPIALCIAIVLCSFLAANEKRGRKCYELPVIMYHHICEKPASWGAYVVSPAEFENDIKYLYEHGYKTVTTKQLIDFEEKGTPLYSKSVMITFDDGYESFYAYAFNILKKYNYTAVFSIIGQEADKYSQKDDHNILYSNCNWNQLKEMYDSGIVEIGNHTYRLHKFGQRQGCKIKFGEDKQEYLSMLKDDITKLQNSIISHGMSSTVFTYPFGKKCDYAQELVSDLGFKVTLDCEEKLNRLYGKGIDELRCLHRFNRASGISTYDFFKKFM